MPVGDKTKNKGGRPRRVVNRKITTIALEESKFRKLSERARKTETSVTGLIRLAVDACYFPNTNTTDPPLTEDVPAEP